jgi:hypothetical protein
MRHCKARANHVADKETAGGYGRDVQHAATQGHSQLSIALAQITTLIPSTR